MIPDSWAGESLGFFFAEDFPVSLVFFRQFRFHFFFLFCKLGSFGLSGPCREGYIGHVYYMVWGLTGNISLSGDEAGFIHILSTENDGELFCGYPSPGPVDVGLHRSEPRVPQDDVSISYVR